MSDISFEGFENRMAVARKARFDSSPQWTLGQLIAEISEITAKDDCWVSYAFGDFVPTTCDSWRGSYEEIAIGYTEFVWANRPLLKDFLKHLKESKTEQFHGYKGGEYYMDDSTPVWVANWGNSGNTGVTGLHTDFDLEGEAYHVSIRTDYCSY